MLSFQNTRTDIGKLILTNVTATVGKPSGTKGSIANRNFPSSASRGLSASAVAGYIICLGAGNAFESAERTRRWILTLSGGYHRNRILGCASLTNSPEAWIANDNRRHLPSHSIRRNADIY